MPSGNKDYKRFKIAAGGMYQNWFEIFLDLLIKINYYSNLVKSGNLQYLLNYYSELYTLYTNLLIVTNDNGREEIKNNSKKLLEECENLLTRLAWYTSSKRSDSLMRDNIKAVLVNNLNKLHCDLTIAFQKTGLGIKMNLSANEEQKRKQRFTN